MNPDETRHCETWKLLIEFVKTVLGLITAVLSALLGLVLLSQIELSTPIKVALALLAVGTVAVLLAFGKSLSVIREGPPKKSPLAVFFANSSAFLLIAALIALSFHSEDSQMDVKSSLSAIESQTRAIGPITSAANVVSLRSESGILEVSYSAGSEKCLVRFSQRQKQIVEVRK